MTDAFLETTVLTDYLLKKDGSEIEAETTLAKYSTVHLPQFAWKEFKRGPLSNFRWAHNKLAETKSFSTTIAALQRMSRSPRGYLTSTAIQAIHTGFSDLFKGVSLQQLAQTYGDQADMDVVQADAMRIVLKKTIYSAWQKRTSLFGGPTAPLSCYPDAELKMQKSRIETDPRDCPKGSACCLQQSLAGRKKDVAAVKDALPTDTRLETSKRYRVLRQLEKRSTSVMGPAECRSFGDAYFALFCPANAVIITTNSRDIVPMASSLGVLVDSPDKPPHE
jgi:hypothetical protein